MDLQLDDDSSLADRVYSVIEEAILSGKISLGERLLENDLADKLAVSRAPLREALRRLHFEGLAVTVPRRGTYVIKPSYQDVLDLLQVREQLECLGARLAATRMSDEALQSLFQGLGRIKALIDRNKNDGYPRHNLDFHQAVLDGSGNKRIIQMVGGMYRQLRLIREMSGSRSERAASALDEHFQIAEALKARDPVAAEERMRVHQRASAESILSTLKTKVDDSDILA